MAITKYTNNNLQTTTQKIKDWASGPSPPPPPQQKKSLLVNSKINVLRRK